MILIRIVIVAFLTSLAVVFPYVLPMISIVTDISVVAAVYIFPPLIYWKLRTNVRKQGFALAWLIRAGLVLIIVYGLLGSAFGLRQALPTLYEAVKHGGNPFAHIFTFGCNHASGGKVPSVNDTICILTNVTF